MAFRVVTALARGLSFLLATLASFVLASTGSTAPLPPTDPITRSYLRYEDFQPYLPHTASSTLFEGYYTKFSFPSKDSTLSGNRDTVAVILCHVTNPKENVREHMLSFSYVPAGYNSSDTTKQKNAIFLERYSKSYQVTANKDASTFEINFGNGEARFAFGPESQTYNLNIPGDNALKFTATVRGRQSWNPNASRFANGPEGYLVHLGSALPLHWYVYSLNSRSEITIDREVPKNAGGKQKTSSPKNEVHLRAKDVATHMEKNWGSSFPAGWIWSQAFDEGKKVGWALAGGATPLASEAYLVGYRSPNLTWDFEPPSSLKLPLLPSATLRVTHDSERGDFDLTAISLDGTRKLEVRARSSAKSYISLPGPLSSGFVSDYAHESFSAEIRIRAYAGTTSLWPPLQRTWTLLEENTLTNAALEFGGDYFKGSSKKN